MQNKRILKSILCLLILIAFFFPFINVITLEALENDDLYIDYSNNAQTRTEYTYSEIIQLITGVEAGNNELDYLSYLYQTNKFLSIEKLIPTTHINTSLNNGNLIVHATSYSYQDTQQNTHIWVPISVSLENNTLSLIKNGETYEAIFNIVPSDIENINVTYECKFILNKDICNTLLNKAYNDAKDFIDAKIIETENEAYRQRLSIYNQYLLDLEKYNQDMITYNLYLDELEEYNEELALYNQYLADKAKYESDVVKYNQYLIDLETYNSNLALYQQYLNDLENYNTAYSQYLLDLDVYNEKMEKVNYNLEVMAAIQLKMTSLERTVYDAVMGSTVTSVLQRKADLVQLQADGEAIDRAEVATIALREIFTQYFEKETDQDKYNFYSYREGLSYSNYVRIKNQIEELLKCLDRLYRSGLVAKVIKDQGKNEKYLILVAQLAIIANALDDKPVKNYEGNDVFDSDWTIDGKTILEILENEVYLEDLNMGYPSFSGYPSVVVEPVAPTVVSQPQAPKQVTQPIEPTVVSQPTPPTVVLTPTEPEAVEEPKEYVVEEHLGKIVNDYKNGTLIQRTSLNNDFELTRQTSVNKNFRNPQNISIEFHNTDGSILCTMNTEKGSYIIYNGIIPTKDADQVNSQYDFIGWKYEDGEILDLNNVIKEGFVYPYFQGTLQVYEVTWIIDNQAIKENYEYGSTPSYKGEPIKEINGNSYFTFKEWNKIIEPVTKNESYEAIFESHKIFEDVKSLEVTNGKAVLSYNENKKTIDIEQLCSYYSKLSTLEIQTDEYQLKIPSSTMKNIMNNNVTEIILNVNDLGNGEYFYSISYKKNDEDIQIKGNMDLTIQGDFDSDHSYLYYKKDGIDYLASQTVVENKISFTMNTSYEYHYYPVYSINITKNDFVGITCNTYTSTVNKTISIYLGSIPNGKKIDKVYVIDTIGNNYELNEQYQFVMPNCDVYIGVNISDIVYTIIFAMDENIISKNHYYYGDEIVIPTSPTKLSDETYSYNFIGWSPSIKMFVNEDMTYQAQFETVETKLVPLDQKMGLIIPGIILSIVLVIGGGTACVILIRKKKTKKGKI